MKTSHLASTLLLLLVSAIATVAYAQPGDLPVKVLPTTQKGIVKILYASEANQPVEIKFFNDGGLIGSDKIKGKSFPNGFSKKYDVRQVKSGDIWVEVSSAQMAVTYRLVLKDGQQFEPLLEKTTYNHTLVAANN